MCWAVAERDDSVHTLVKRCETSRMAYVDMCGHVRFRRVRTAAKLLGTQGSVAYRGILFCQVNRELKKNLVDCTHDLCVHLTLISLHGLVSMLSKRLLGTDN